MNTTRILIADDHEAIRKAVRSTLSECSCAEVIGEAENGQEAIEKSERLHPDLIIMDLSMPVLDGLTAAEVIRKNSPQTAIVMFSAHNGREVIEATKRLGLHGFVSKDADGPSLLKAVEAVQHKRTYFPS